MKGRTYGRGSTWVGQLILGLKLRWEMISVNFLGRVAIGQGRRMGGLWPRGPPPFSHGSLRHGNEDEVVKSWSHSAQSCFFSMCLRGGCKHLKGCWAPYSFNKH